jgi:hypothetical protein
VKYVTIKIVGDGNARALLVAPELEDVAGNLVIRVFDRDLTNRDHRPRPAEPSSVWAARAVGLVNGFVTTEFNDGSMSGQLGDDRSERISGVGADNEV